MAPALRLIRTVFRQVYRLLFRTPLEHIVAAILVLSVSFALLTLTEPAFSLRFRRGVGVWKIVPYLCNAPWFQSYVDAIFGLGNIPAVALIIMLARYVATFAFFPMVSFVTALSKPAIVRSVILLVGLPTLLLSLCCKLHIRMIRQNTGAAALVTLTIVSSIVLGLGAYNPALLEWGISDVSVPTYLVILTSVLLLVTAQERMSATAKKKTKTRCYDQASLCSLYLLAGVTAVWILRASDSTSVALIMLKDLRRLSATPNLHPHAFPRHLMHD